MSMPMVAITGANGGLGQRLVAAAQRRKHPVLALSRQPVAISGPGSTWRRLDLDDPHDRLEERFAGAEAVVHLAACIAGQNPSPDVASDLWRVNVLGTARVIRAAAEAGVRHVVVASTANFYRPDLGEALETSPVEPESRALYFGSKAAQEWTARELCASLGLPCAVMRISSVIGMDRNIVDSFAHRLVAGETVTVADDGAFGADFVAAEDVVTGLLLAVERKLTGVFNLSSSRRSLLGDVARRLAELAGRPSEAVREVAAEGRADRGFPAINCDRLRAFGYAPTPIAASLAQMIERASAPATLSRAGSLS